MASDSGGANALNRRAFLGLSLAVSAAPLLAACGATATATSAVPKAVEPTTVAAVGTDRHVASTPTSENWSPETIRALAGTLAEVDTRAGVAKVAPLETRAKLTYWYSGPTQASPTKDRGNDEAFWAAWNEMVPGVPMKLGDNVQSLDRDRLLATLRTAAAGGTAPHCVKLPIMFGCEFASKAQFQDLKPDDLGYARDSYWPGALKSVGWKGKLYGVPTNNDAMAFVWNRSLFKAAGLDPERPPTTWDDVAAASKAIRDATGEAGLGLVARVNDGDTSSAFMPMLWAYGSGVLDEAEASATMDDVLINNEGGVRAFDLIKRMHVDDRSVPISTLTNTNAENVDLFAAGQIAMFICRTSEYATLIDRANRAAGSDRVRAQAILGDTACGPIPTGPVRRAVVIGGSNFHVFTDKAAGSSVPRPAVTAFGAFCCGPEWSLKAAWTDSNPSHLGGFKTTWMKERLDSIALLDYSSSMLPYGVPFPVIPEATEIVNSIVPSAMQNVLTGKMSSKQAVDGAAEKIRSAISWRKD